jgi:transposase
MYYTGADLHKDNCFLTTINDEGRIVRQQRIANEPAVLCAYFASLPEAPHRVVVESTAGWYWFVDTLEDVHIDVVLAHAKYLKAIAYAKVKTDKVDSLTLAQLLRMNLIPVAHTMSRELRSLRDILRARLRLVQKRTSCYNSLHRIGEKFHLDDGLIEQNAPLPEALPEPYHLQVHCLWEQVRLLDLQIRRVEHALNERLLERQDVQRLLYVPGFGPLVSSSVVLELDTIDRFAEDRQLFSYARLVPGAKNSNTSMRHKSANKDGNKYLKIAFTHAAVHAIRFDPDVRAFYQRIRRRSGEAIARTVVAKELARIVFYMLKYQTPYRGFKGQPITHPKPVRWPRKRLVAAEEQMTA